nr:tetratricopeptide repeat protein [Chitinophagales bacterium]
EKDIEMCRKNIGFVHYRSKRHTEALDCYQQNLAYAQRVGDKRSLAEALANIATIQSEKGLQQAAITSNEQVIIIAQELGAPHVVALCKGNLASIYYEIGQTEKAIECHNESIKILKALQMKEHIIIMLIQQSSFMLGMIEADREANMVLIEKIDQNLSEAVRYANEIKRPDFAADVEYLYWRANLLFNLPDEAEKHRLAALNQLLEIGEENLRIEQKQRITELTTKIITPL